MRQKVNVLGQGVIVLTVLTVLLVTFLLRFASGVLPTIFFVNRIFITTIWRHNHCKSDFCSFVHAISTELCAWPYFLLLVERRFRSLAWFSFWSHLNYLTIKHDFSFWKWLFFPLVNWNWLFFTKLAFLYFKEIRSRKCISLIWREFEDS